MNYDYGTASGKAQEASKASDEMSYSVSHRLWLSRSRILSMSISSLAQLRHSPKPAKRKRTQYILPNKRPVSLPVKVTGSNPFPLESPNVELSDSVMPLQVREERKPIWMPLCVRELPIASLNRFILSNDALSVAIWGFFPSSRGPRRRYRTVVTSSTAPKPSLKDPQGAGPLTSLE